VGTTDTPIETPLLEPLPLEQEIEFILSTAARYLEKAPARSDVLSVFVGIRPLVRASDAKNTASLSRDHTIHIDDSALLTIAGGKWTTYRHMAEDCVDQAATLARLPDKPCITKKLNVHGFHDNAEKFGDLWFYGSDAHAIQNLAQTQALGARLHPDLPYIEAEVVWAVREEMARTVEDVLARRTRALFLNAKAALAAAPRVAELIAGELGMDAGWREAQISEFRAVAAGYVIGYATDRTA